MFRKEPARFLREKPFPIGHPTGKRNVEPLRSGEEMQMVGHQQIVADQPGIGFGPALLEEIVNGRLRQPRDAFFRADGDEDDGGFGQRNMDARVGFVAAEGIVF